MIEPFEVVTDRLGRIEHYLADGHPQAPIKPEDMGQFINGDGRIIEDGTEYDIDENGRMIHPDVDVPPFVSLGSGVRIESGTSISSQTPTSVARPYAADELIIIGDRTRLKGPEINHQVTIGKHNFIRARSVGACSLIGDHCRIGGGITIGKNVVISNSVWMDGDSLIFGGGHVSDRARIGYRVTLMANSVVRKGAQVGKYRGHGYEDGQDGPVIKPGRVIAPGARIL